MTSELTKNCDWYQIVIDDAPKFLPGKSFIDMFKLLSSKIEFNFIITDEMDGLGKEISVLKEKCDTVIKFNEIFDLIYNVNQFEWGDFFLFKEYPQNWSNPKGTMYPSLIAQSDTTVRAVDNQYFYIYTPYREIVEVLKNNYVLESVEIGPLDILDYPY